MSEFKELAEGIQAIVISIGVLIGGAWALYQFFSLNAIDKAKFELEKFKKELIEKGAIKIELTISQIQLNPKTIITVVKFLNSGNRTEVLNWRSAELKVAKIELQKNGEALFSNQTIARLNSINREWTSSSLHPFVENEYPFIVNLPESGLYLFEFDVQGSKHEMTAHHEAISNSGFSSGSYTWSTSKYFDVK